MTAPIELTFPPKLVNLAWRQPHPEKSYDLDELRIDFAKHLAEGPCPCYLLVFIPAHSGLAKTWMCWCYNDFRDVEHEKGFWRGDAPPEFMREHRSLGRKFSEIYADGRDFWMVLRDDLSYKPELTAPEFAKIRFITMDEIKLRPGHSRDFTELRHAIAAAHRKAKTDGPVWVYENYSGGDTDSYQVWTPIESIVDLNLVPQTRDRLTKALGEANRLSDLEESSIAESQTALLAISPGGSYVPSTLAAGDPDFWQSRTRPFP